MILAAELLTAYLTLVRSLSSVHFSEMLLSVPSRRELPLAYLTLVRLLFLVYAPHVDVHKTSMSEPPLAYLALKWFLSCMDLEMAFQVPLARNFLLTNGTLISHYCTVLDYFNGSTVSIPLQGWALPRVAKFNGTCG